MVHVEDPVLTAVTVRKVPAEVVAELRRQAHAQHRSLESHLRHVLTEQARGEGR